MRFADLHLHTLFSDGTHEPREALRQARESGLSCISIVDHDTIDGIKPAIACAKDYGVEVVSGIELSAEYDGREVHILGYFIDYEHKKLLHKLEFLRHNRISRIYEMVSRLNGLGLKLKAEEVFNISQSAPAGRLHLARAMLKAGLVESTSEAFNKYIGDRGPAYFCGFKLSPGEAIDLIKDAAGIPVLAHPYTLGDDSFILRLIEDGVMGLEVYYPEHTQSLVNFYLGLAKKHNLLVTGGSDCHGAAKPQVRIGSIKIPYILVERLKTARDRLVC